MPSRLQMAKLLPRRAPQLQCINEEIARLAACKTHGDLYSIFSLAAQFAGDAIEGATELQNISSIDPRALQCALDFWYRTRDYSGAAALNCIGGNQTVAEALVTFRMMRTRRPNGGT